MPIEIRKVETKSDLKKFIYLPAEIHKNHENWAPPMYMDEFTFFDPKKNKSFDHSEAILAMAYKDNVPVGRIMGIIEKRYNQIHNENDARFAFIETHEDPEIFNALIAYIENWAREKKCDNLVGPLGFSDKDPQGFIIEGFDKPLIIAANANFPFMPKFIENLGFEKKVDLIDHCIPIPEEVPALYNSIYERVMRNNPNLRLIEFKSRLKLRKYIKPILTLLNDTFKNIYAFSPFEDYEMKDFANRYIFVLDPAFVKAIEDEKGTVLAFIVGMPELTQGIKKANGHMIPFGIFKVWAEQKRTKQLTLLLGGIKPEIRGKGLDVILGKAMLKSAHEHGFEFIDSHLQLEYNYQVHGEMQHMGGKIYKRFRIYTKKL